jgi:lipopolysaccharide transport system ATP-binding protein
MSDTAIQVKDLSKRYRLGVVGTGTLSHDLNRWWARMRGRPDPTLKVDAVAVGGRTPMAAGNDTPSAGSAASHDHLSASDYMWALNELSFEVRRGEILGIIGRNGAGKSTLLKILSRVTAPTSGEVRVRGRIASLLEIGTGFHPELTGRENIILNGAILGMKRAETMRVFDEIVAFSGVGQYIDTPVKRYSSGMYVRLAFAVAAHLESDVLLVDEVLAVGDLAFQERCLGRMSDVVRDGRVVLFVSHNMGSISSLCPNCLWLDNGALKRIGPTPLVVPDYVRNAGLDLSDGVVFIESDSRREVEVGRVRVLSASGDVCAIGQCSESLTIEMLLDVRRHVPGLYAYVEVRLPNGTTVLMSESLDTNPNPLDSLAPGRQLVTFTIPPRTLGAGKYDVYVNLASPAGREFNVHSPGVVCSFRLDDSTSLRGNARPGFFSTLLEWEARDCSTGDE